MSGGEGAVKLLVGILVSALIALTVVVIFDALLQTGLSPKPGDPLYPAWVNQVNANTVVLPLTVVGVGTVAAFLIAQLRGGF
ncbi:hypothetical protein ACFQH3_13760 [Haladaptatus sp. GCM10025707]|uniref:hypothetical protein n=1 Tax=unclassified Haladaptatus TaxID=2622732 RepID=UPI0023E80954|nr:hypothetical protein [Haladaptatus sp. QDMS2]